ncbi:MAG: CorA family divalent cation transporter [Candidatus Kaiserbacteria bacterium]|nr:CorA family divalent cation transporter [Candidatus Kaiserbacteria bacterium]
MIFRYAYRGGVWVDLEQPTEDEIRQIAQEFSISELIEKELFSPTPAPLVVDGGTSILLVLHFPEQQGTENGDIENQEIDFIVGDRFIVTARYEVIAPLHHLKKLFETRDLVTGHESITTDVLLEILFAHLYAAIRDHTNHLTDCLERIERDMFDGRERVTVRAISNVSRAFLHLEAALANQEEPLSRFLGARTLHDLFDSSFNERAERILAERAQAMRLIKTHRAVATEMRETNTALLESHQNEIMKTLTVITFIFLPLELITFVFGMGALGTPLKQNPHAFWIIIGSMFTLGMVITLFLARKRWIF